MNDETPTTDALTIHGAPVASEIGQILRFAIESKVPVDTIERLVALKERMDMRTAAMDFNLALAAFQAECPPIRKTSRATITTKTGGQYAYSYAELDQIAQTTRPLLTKHGLSYSWDSDLEGNKLVCTCTLRHVSGHSQSAKFSVSTDTTSAMSDQQKVAAALTYARRQSLIQALGLTTTDSGSYGGAPPDAKVSEEQAAELTALVASSGADPARFLAYMRVGTIEEIQARDFSRAKMALNAKAKKP
jgi:hypothetical protein